MVKETELLHLFHCGIHIYRTGRHSPDISSQHRVSVRSILYVSERQVGVSEKQMVSAPMIVHTKTADNRIVASPEASTSSMAALHFL